MEFRVQGEQCRGLSSGSKLIRIGWRCNVCE
jgi:hypothetical protein